MLTGPASGLVGSPGTWTATATGFTTPVYQFNVTPTSGPTSGVSQMVQDFSTSNSFVWNPIQQGGYTVQVSVEDGFGNATSYSSSDTYTANTRITGTGAVITPMANPLVALYSAPPTTDTHASSMYVQYSLDQTTWLSTASQSILSGDSTNFIVAGLLPGTTYYMRTVLNDGTISTPTTFTTGSLPTSLTFPTVTIPTPAGPNTDMTDNMIVHMGIGSSTPNGNVTLFATNLSGKIDWYYDPVANNLDGYGTELVPGGTVLFLGGRQSGQGGESVVEEMDLAGDTLRETNVNAINAELAALGQDQIININHEALRLPNGDTAILATNQEVHNLNGTPTTYDGDMVIVLDQNFQVKWVWNAFNYLNTNRLPTDGEGPGDWLHANSISWSPEDGDLLVSLRAQDWVIKIDYSNGTGDGHVVWTLGADGNLGAGGSFTLNSSNPNAWFGHQHDAVYINDNTIVLFDDNNTQKITNPNADSYGQEWILNEQTMTATPVVDVDLLGYSAALGSAQVLSDGDLDFDSGLVGGTSGQSIEVSPDGNIDYVMQVTGIQYRSYFMSTLYSGDNNTQGLLDPGFELPSQGSGTSAYQYDPPVGSYPTGSPWSFGGTAGVAGNGSTITSGNPNAPQGSQVAFIEGTGTISQVANSLAPTYYQLSFLAGQRSNNTNNEEIEVEVDGIVVAPIIPTSTSYATYTTPYFNLTAGSHTITFVGVDPSSADDDTVLLDQVSLSAAPSASAAFLETDTSTEGNWKGVYGSQGYNVIGDQSSGNPSYPSYAQVTPIGNSEYTWYSSAPPASLDPRALQDASGSGRTAGAWFSNHTFTVNVNITDNQTHQLALYLVDWENQGRSEQISIVNGATGVLLSTQTVSNFSNGEYLVWNVSGDITIQVTFLGSVMPANAVLSGLFFDPPGTAPPPPPPLPPAPPAPPPAPGAASFLETDTTTEGSWQGVYGSQGYNVIDDASSSPSYAQVTATGNSNYVWTGTTSDPRALQEVGNTDRIAAAWFSNTSFTVNVNITDGQTHQVALYLLDWENEGRSEEIDILDATTGKVLSTETASNFSTGEYLVWNVSGDITIQVKFLGSTEPANAVLSGLFFDPPGTAPPPAPPAPPPAPGAASFLKTDTTTEGSWQGVYGSQGYNVIDDVSSYPSYAQVTATGNSNYVWTSSTSDKRALQEVGSSNRIAAAWFTNTSFTVNVNITDGQTHQLALYLLDWENQGRSEEIDILDATTGNVLSTEMASNFSTGEYLVWDVSGDITIRVKFLGSTQPANAVLSGLFFG